MPQPKTTQPESPALTPAQAREKLATLYKDLAPKLREYNQAAQEALQLSKTIWDDEIKTTFPGVELTEMLPIMTLSAQENPAKATELFSQPVAGGAVFASLPVKLVVFNPQNFSYQFFLK